MGNASSHRDSIPADELPAYEQLAPNVCVLSFQGYRLHMEDGYDFQVFDIMGLTALAVFDGHSGKGSMEYAKSHLLKHITFEVAADAECADIHLRTAFMSTERGLKTYNTTKVLESAKKFEAERLAHAEAGGGGAPPPLRITSHSYEPDRSGTCAIVALIKDGELIIANAGDCTALLIKKDGSHQILNTLHRPNSVLEGSYMQHCSEGVRIYEAGLCVQQNRVNGELAVSRSIGDFTYKGIFEEESKHAVTCIPSITRIPIDDTFQCLYLYSDGIGDGMEPAQIAEHLTNPHVQPREKLESLLRACMEKSRDNATIARIDF